MADQASAIAAWQNALALATAYTGGSPPPVLAIGARVRAFAVGKPNVTVRATPVQGGTQLQPPQPQNALGVIVAPGESGGYWKIDFDTGVDGWVWAANLTAI